MQPTHATSDMPWAVKRVGEERLAGAYAWHTLLDSGAVLAFGSDFPVESVNPLWGLYSAVTRADHAGEPAGGWRASEALSMEQAVRAFTAGAAYAAFDDGDAGIIAVGKRADLSVFDRDVFAVAPRELLDTRCCMTIVRGVVVYEAAP